MKNRLLAILLLLAVALPAAAQKIPTKREQKQICDSLSARISRRMTSKVKVDVKNCKVEKEQLEYHFTEDLMFCPWHESDQIWFKRELLALLAEYSDGQDVGDIYAGAIPFEELITPPIGNKGGFTSKYEHRVTDPRKNGVSRFITRLDGRWYPEGLSDRYISLWQSHGRYFNDQDSVWLWQRATLHRTVEDMYTQSYVLPFLIPMLENAGAYVMTPRERDTQRYEVVCDNDPTFRGRRDSLTRRHGRYAETGEWHSGGTGFADIKQLYTFSDNPFIEGTARICACSGEEATATAKWTPEFRQRGSYAVYVSYKSLANSSTEAHYSVHHMGGTTEFTVNQKRGGQTWIYLGTFEFDEQGDYYVELDNCGSRYTSVSADAVKFGGGMGKVSRGGSNSGYPAYMEGSLYSMAWYGIDSTLFKEWEGDYTRDFASRGKWANTMKSWKNIPFDMSIAFHSDAGTTPDDEIVGTLSIYTLLNNRKREYSNGRDRMQGRLLAEYVQSQVVDDIRADYEPKWTRRNLWDKSYSECRTPEMPAMILELLSHQNFSDMKYGLDPAFRFTVSRAVYKGILKFLSELYGCRYTVQPLPVNSFAATVDESGRYARLSWLPTEDKKEPTAAPTGYILYTRVDDGAFDGGTEVEGCRASVPLKPGHIYSFKVEAFNNGGKSFPSEILALGTPENAKTGRVLIVNNFDRISAPTWAESPGYAGFEGRLDGGVPWINDISYIGENYEFRRQMRWETDMNPGFGASFDDRAGDKIAGNTFDFPYLHGKSLMKLGIPFCSISRDAFCASSVDSLCCSAMDLICGKQVTTKIGSGRVPDRYEVFPYQLQDALRKWTKSGKNILISGSCIATDAWSAIYPIDRQPDIATQDFIMEVLGYKFASAFGTSRGSVYGTRKSGFRDGMTYYSSPNTERYCVEASNGLSPVDKNGKIVLRYTGTNTPAAVQYNGAGYKVFAVGVPLECFKDDSDREMIFESAYL